MHSFISISIKPCNSTCETSINFDCRNSIQVSTLIDVDKGALLQFRKFFLMFGIVALAITRRQIEIFVHVSIVIQ